MGENNIVQIIIALIGLAGICYQAYCSRKSREGKDDQTKEINEKIEESKQIAQESLTSIKILRRELAANNQATIASARSVIKRVYDQLREERVITYDDLEMVEELYAAYKNVRYEDGHVPNGYADACVEEMRRWKRVESHHEYKDGKPLDITQ